MRTKNKTAGQEPSFIEQARRTQIIACAIETIAELGYAQASLAQIGQRAGISKGVISYHFASKEALIQAVLKDVLDRFATFVLARVPDEEPWEALRGFLLANADFLKAHRAQLMSLFEIVHHAHDLDLDGYDRERDVQRIATLLAEGQRRGVFRTCDVMITASSILTLRDSLIAQSAKCADLDIDRYVQELITLIDHAIRRPA
jgi:AcrR family transcriptional regulator